VVPFYMKMMATNALANNDAFLRRIVRAGRSSSTGDVVALLRDPWRATVMGRGLQSSTTRVRSKRLSWRLFRRPWDA
jgi:hypothetical protein